MPNLNFADYKALTGDNTVTGWVKYNWIGSSTTPSPEPEPGGPDTDIPDNSIFHYNFLNPYYYYEVANTDAGGNTNYFEQGKCIRRNALFNFSLNSDGVHAINNSGTNNGRVGFLNQADAESNEFPEYSWKVKFHIDSIDSSMQDKGYVIFSLFFSSITETTEALKLEFNDYNQIKISYRPEDVTTQQQETLGIPWLNQWNDFSINFHENTNKLEIVLNNNIIWQTENYNRQNVFRLNIAGTNKLDVVDNYPLTIQYIKAEEITE